MADVSVVAASVLKIDGSTDGDVLAGATITAGQAVYLDPLTNTYLLAQSDGVVVAPAGGVAGLAESTVKGIALHAALAGQPLRVLIDGTVALGTATLVLGGVYVLSATAGGICPVADVVSTNYVTILGVAVATNQLRLKINASGIKHA